MEAAEKLQRWFLMDQQYIPPKAQALLLDLMAQNTEFSEKGFSLHLADRQMDFDRAIRALGRKNAYARMSEYICDTYARLYGRPYLFSERCIRFEIQYHVDTFFRASGYPGYPGYLPNLLFRRAALILHTKEVDVSTDDVADWRQRSMFGYRRGIRPCHRRTEKDPFFRQLHTPFGTLRLRTAYRANGGRHEV